MNISEVMARNAAARDIVVGLASATPALSAAWRAVGAALADSVGLAAELSAARLDRANLRAAMRAALAADRDGETDPLWYLRDALTAPQSAPQIPSRGSSDD